MFFPVFFFFFQKKILPFTIYYEWEQERQKNDKPNVIDGLTAQTVQVNFVVPFVERTSFLHTHSIHNAIECRILEH